MASKKVIVNVSYEFGETYVKKDLTITQDGVKRISGGRAEITDEKFEHWADELVKILESEDEK